MLKSTSVSPGAVMKNGIWSVAIGLGDAVKSGLLSGWRIMSGSIASVRAVVRGTLI
jgi:hypothetical protein